MAVAYLIGGPADLVKINVSEPDSFLSVPYADRGQPLVTGTNNPVPHTAVMHYAFYRMVRTEMEGGDAPLIYVYDPEINRTTARISGSPYYGDRQIL